MNGNIFSNEAVLHGHISSNGNILGTIKQDGFLSGSIFVTENENILIGSVAIENSGVLNGSIKYDGILSGHLVKEATITGNVAIATGYDFYLGDYDVTPKIESQILLTSNKVMSKDVKINGVPYYEVSNPQGGTTFIIAEI